MIQYPLPFYTTFLATTLVFSFTSIANAQDPTCRKGFEVRGACCPLACGQCGGANCGAKGKLLGTSCCVAAILKNTKSCNANNPPCKLRRSRQTPATWVIAQVNRGQVVARHEACAVVSRGLVVLVGGRGLDKPVSIYNPKTKVWKRGASPGRNIEIHHFQCVVIGANIWIVSSWTGGYPFERENNKVFVYNVPQNKWRRYPGMPSDRNRGGAAAVRRGDYIYVVGGNRGGHGAHSTSLNWMDSYNWRQRRWLKKKFPNLPGGGRDHVGGAMVGRVMCIAGGRNGGVKNFNRASRSTVFCYNFTNQKWIRKANLAQPRAGAMTGTTCDKKLMIAGGEGFGRAYNRVDIFDGNKWERGPDMKRSRHGSGLAITKCSCGHIFVPSGSGRQGGSPELLTTDEYIPQGGVSNCLTY